MYTHEQKKKEKRNYKQKLKKGKRERWRTGKEMNNNC